MACELNPPGEQDVFAFAGQANEHIIVRVGPADSDGVSLETQIVAPDGTTICSGINGSNSKIRDCTLPETATYQIVVTDRSDDDTNNYIIFLESLTNPSESTEIAYGTSMRGEIVTGTEADFYTFEGTANEYILARVGNRDDYISLNATIVAPDGTIICNDNTSGSGSETYSCTLPRDGTYKLYVVDYHLYYTSGYTLFLDSINTPINSTSIAYGTSLDGTIVVPEADFYTFTGMANERILVRSILRDNSGSTNIRVAGPDGKIICSGYSASSELDDCLLPQNGTYQVIVTEGQFVPQDNTINYTIFIDSITNPNNSTPIEYGMSLDGTIVIPEVYFYTFTGTANERILVQSILRDNSGSTDVRVAGPDGKIICSGYYASSLDDCLLPQNGTYQVIVTEGMYRPQDNTINYTIFLDNQDNPSTPTPTGVAPGPDATPTAMATATPGADATPTVAATATPTTMATATPDADTTPTATPETGSTRNVTINYGTGKPGSRFVIRGYNFVSISNVNVSVNGSSVTSISISNNSFTISLVTSSSAQVGTYRVSISTSSGRLAADDDDTLSTEYILDADAPLREEQPDDATVVEVPETIPPAAALAVFLPLVVR